MVIFTSQFPFEFKSILEFILIHLLNLVYFRILFACFFDFQIKLCFSLKFHFNQDQWNIVFFERSNWYDQDKSIIENECFDFLTRSFVCHRVYSIFVSVWFSFLPCHDVHLLMTTDLENNTAYLAKDFLELMVNDDE